MQYSNGSAAGSSSASGGASATTRNSKRPKYSRFTQQELPACKPILTPRWVISVFTLIGVIFVPIGIAALKASIKVVEIVYRYDDDCVPPNMASMKVAYVQNDTIDKTCTRTLKEAWGPFILVVE